MRGLLLLITAILLAAVLLPLGFIYGIATRSLKAIDTYLFMIAKSLDQHANVVCDELFNHTLIKRDGYKFGNEDRTISHVVGVNKQQGTLTIVGKGLERLLNAIDRNHVEKAIGH